VTFASLESERKTANSCRDGPNKPDFPGHSNSQKHSEILALYQNWTTRLCRLIKMEDNMTGV
jgi:hypothetical protein